jgi:hypothetical protein
MDIANVVGLEHAIAAVFISNGHRPLTEEEVRACALSYALIGGVIEGR